MSRFYEINYLRVSNLNPDATSSLCYVAVEMKTPRKSQTRKRLPSDKRKRQILDAARHLFAKRGYDKTTLDDIARRVGISRPRVVWLFGSKQKIYYMAIAEMAYKAHPMDKDLAEPIRKKDDFAVFREFAFHILSHTRRGEDREIAKILMYARFKEDSFYRTHFHEKDNLMMSRLADYVRARVEEGAFKPMDYRTIVYAYQAMISNLVIYRNVLKQMEFVSIDELAQDCARIFLAGVLAS